MSKEEIKTLSQLSFMNRNPISKQYALSMAKKLKEQLQLKHIPLQQIFVFGSAIHRKTHEWSDIDIAIICTPFLSSKFDEQHTCSREARLIDVRAEVVCLHQEDLQNKYFTLAQEVKRNGIPV